MYESVNIYSGLRVCGSKDSVNGSGTGMGIDFKLWVSEKENVGVSGTGPGASSDAMDGSGS